MTEKPAAPAEGLREERAAAYCASEHGRHASGPACDDGRRHAAAPAEGLAAAAQPILNRALDVFDPDDLDPESSLAMPVTLKARWVYALRAALQPPAPAEGLVLVRIDSGGVFPDGTTNTPAIDFAAPAEGLVEAAAGEPRRYLAMAASMEARDRAEGLDLVYRIVGRVANMGGCSQTHHEHLRRDARTVLAALTQEDKE